MKRALLVLLLLAGCGPRMNQPGTDFDRIVAADFANIPGQDAWEIVQRLRPAWLVKRAAPDSHLAAESMILVYMNDLRLGGAESLRDVQRSMIQSIRVLDAAEATALVGLESKHVDRVIVVDTKPGG